jgi:hypothetical protein
MADEVTIKVSNDNKGNKKVTTRKKTIKSATKRTSTRTKTEEKNIEKILIENFIAMQKVMTHMAEKFDHLTKQISGLLTLFEDSAKTLNEKEINLELKNSQDPKQVLDKLNTILDQNKLIAKGLTLMHDTAANPETHYSLAPQMSQGMIKTATQEMPQVSTPQQPIPQIPVPKPTMMPSQANMSQPSPTPEMISKSKTPGTMEEPEPFKAY